MINNGLLILIGIEESDNDEDIEWLVKKCVNLRIFDDEQGIMNKSILDSGGDVLAVSQFTLMASTKKRQPSIVHKSRKARNIRSAVRSILPQDGAGTEQTHNDRCFWGRHASRAYKRRPRNNTHRL